MLRVRASWLALLALPATFGCRSFAIAGGPGFDAGTLAVGGIDTGIGAYAEALAYTGSGATAAGFGPTLQIAGFETDGDADPIAFASIEARYRTGFGPAGTIRPIWSLGAGLGMAWSPGLSRVAVPLQGEVGLQASAGAFSMALGVRERFLPLIGIESPPFDAHNTVLMVLTFAVTRPRDAR
jgi:hypothetical protein